MSALPIWRSRRVMVTSQPLEGRYGGTRGRFRVVVLSLVRDSVWLLVLNCAQNLITAPRATASWARLRARKREQAPGPWPRVSVLVPARNEAANIETCLRGLLGQSYPAIEIVVCDDRSTDTTPAIVQAIAGERGNGRLRLIRGQERPPGWSGKNWACHQLATVARGEWLLFTDADTRHEPDSVAAALALAWEHQADFVSLLPRHRAETLGERLLVSQLPLIVFALLPIALVSRQSRWARPFAGANGLYLFLRRDWYDALGGYATVRDAIAEDMRFAVATKQRGGRLVLADGSAVLTCRMYQSFADAWHGCTRNAFPAALASTPIFLTFTAGWGLLFVLPPLIVLGGWVNWIRGQRGRVGTLNAAVTAVAGQLVLRYLVGRQQGRPVWEVLLQPLSALLTLGVLLDSYRQHRLDGAIVWRGRRYDQVA